MITIPQKIKQRIDYLQQGISNLEREQIEIVNIFLESIGEDEPVGRKWKIDGDNVVFEEQQTVIEETDTPKE